MKTRIAVMGMLSLCLILTCSASSSPQDLTDNFWQGYQNGDLEELKSLYCWENIDSSMAQLTHILLNNILDKQNLDSITLAPHDPAKKTEHRVKGYKYRPNLKVQGYLKLYHKGQASYVTWLPYGKQQGKYLLTNTIKKYIGGKSLEQKQYTVMISRTVMSNSDEDFQYKGYIKYKNIEEIKQRDLSGRHSATHSLFGNRIIEAKIAKVNTGIEPLQMTIKADDKVIFKSQKIRTQQNILYKGENE